MAKLVADVEKLAISDGPSERNASPFRFPPTELSILKRHPELFNREKVNLEKNPLSIDNIHHNDNLVKLYTGISSAHDFSNLLLMFSNMNINYYLGWAIGKLHVKDQLFLTLMKLKMGLGDKELAHRFQCSLDIVTNSVLTWLFALHEILYDSSIALFKNTIIPVHGSRQSQNPKLILGFVNVYGDIPKNVKKLVLGAPKEPFRGLLCINLDGAVCFAGSLYTWFSSERSIIYDSGVLDLVESGDMVVADADFQVENLAPETVHICNDEPTSSEAIIDHDYVTAKKDMREVLRRIRQFEVINCIPTELLPYANAVWQVCAILSNWLQ